MTTLQAIVMAVLQGVTELFPVSSLGHAVVLPHLLHWSVDQESSTFLPFLVVLHLGTAAALLLFFWRDWLYFAGSVVGVGPIERRRQDRRVFLLVVVGTVPAAIIGGLLQKPLTENFGRPSIAAVFLLVNGAILFVGERRRRAGCHRTLDGLRWSEALWVGLGQSAALIPGISRSGASMVAGLVTGLRHEDAARFSFLLATPVILGAGVLEVPKLLKNDPGGMTGLAVVAGLVAGVTAYLSVAFLMRYFRRHDFEALDPFAYYSWGAGVVFLGLLAILS